MALPQGEAVDPPLLFYGVPIVSFGRLPLPEWIQVRWVSRGTQVLAGHIVVVGGAISKAWNQLSIVRHGMSYLSQGSE